MRPNIKVVVTFEEFEAFINAKTRGTKVIHVVGAECENDAGMVILSVLDMSAKPLPEQHIAYRVLISDFDIHKNVGKDVHRCISTPDGCSLKKFDGEWRFHNLGRYAPIVEYCPFCGVGLEV